MSHLPCMAFIKEAGGRYIYANETFEHVGGIPHGRATGMMDEDLWPDELADSLRTGDRLVETLHAPLETLEEFPRAGGVHRWLLTKFPVSNGDAAGAVVGGVAIDITARTDYEVRIREERDRAQRYLDVAGVAIVAFDPQDKVTLINRKGCELLGRAELDVVGRNWFDSFVPERARERSRRRLRRLARAGEPGPPRSGERGPTGMSDAFEDLVLTGDGRERTVAWHAATMRDAHGRIVGVLASGEDVTDRGLAQEALRESERRYRLLAENATDMIWTSDLQGRILYVSPSVKRTLGLSSERLIGSSYKSIITLSSYDVAAGALAQELARERSGRGDRFRSWTLELEMACDDGSTVWTETTTSFLRTQGGVPTGALSVSRNITRRKALEQELLRSQKLEAIGRLAGGVAHDFNNLLTAIIGYGERVLPTLEDPDAIEQIRQITNAGEMAASLTRNLLAFSRGQEVQAREVQLNSIIENLTRLLERVLGDHIILETRLCPDLADARAEPAMLEQAIVNLVVNSRDAISGSGRITVETWNADVREGEAPAGVEPGQYVALRISDTGCGMDEETMSHVFEPFFTTKDRGRGTGLGLSTAYGVVKNSGGHIWVESEESKGTAFNVYLPRVAGAVRNARGSGPTEPSDSLALGCETVLLVEDNEMVRNLARAALCDCGYAVIEAANGEDAIQSCTRHDGPIELLVTDVVMPGMGGRELSGRIARERPGLRVLYVSGYTEDHVVRSGRLQPGTAFLEKPFTPETLARKARELLDADACVAT